MNSCFPIWQILDTDYISLYRLIQHATKLEHHQLTLFCLN